MIEAWTEHDCSMISMIDEWLKHDSSMNEAWKKHEKSMIETWLQHGQQDCQDQTKSKHQSYMYEAKKNQLWSWVGSQSCSMKSTPWKITTNSEKRKPAFVMIGFFSMDKCLLKLLQHVYCGHEIRSRVLIHICLEHSVCNCFVSNNCLYSVNRHILTKTKFL